MKLKSTLVTSGILNTTGIQSVPYQTHGWTTAQTSNGVTVSWMNNPFFDGPTPRVITKEELLEEFKTSMGKSDLTLEDLTDLQSKLFEMIDKVKSEKHVSIDITL